MRYMRDALTSVYKDEYLEGSWELYYFSNIMMFAPPLGPMNCQATCSCTVLQYTAEFFPVAQALGLIRQLLLAPKIRKPLWHQCIDLAGPAIVWFSGFTTRQGYY